MSYLTGIQYSIYNDAEIKAPDVLIKTSGAKDEVDSIYDPRLGVNQYICSACNQSEKLCQGHYGKVYTSMVIPNPAFWSSKIVTDFIKHICPVCGILKPISNLDIKTRQLIEVLDVKKKQDRKELKRISVENNLQNSNNKKCNSYYCKHRSNNTEIIVFEKKSGIFKKKLAGNEKHIEIRYEQVFKLIKQCPKYCYLFGINIDPKNFFYNRFLPIPPITIRPSNFFYSGSTKKSFNELGSNLSALVKCIFNTSGEMSNDIKETQIYKNLLVIDEGKNKTVNNGDTYENNLRYSGIYKKNIAGRRIDNIGRYVIGPAEEDIKIGEISVPKAALKMTKRLYINYITLKTLDIKEVIKVATEYYNYKTKQLTNLKYKNKTIINLKPGDWLTVPLEENDFIIFGRQPCLHKYNVQGAIMKINDAYTLRVSQLVVTGQNADFDGDEEWMCSFTKNSTTVEVATLLIPSESISMGAGFSAFNLLQDEIISLHILSSTDKIPIEQCNFLIGKIGKIDKELSGLELINLFLVKKKKTPLTADDLGYSKKNSILINEAAFIGTKNAINTLDKLSYIAKRHFVINPLSIGLDLLNILDVCALKKTRSIMLDQLYSKYNEYFKKVNNKEIVPYNEQYVYNKIFQLFTNFQLQNISLIKEYYESKNSKFKYITNSKTKVSFQDLTSIVCMNGIIDIFFVPTLFNKANPYKYNALPTYDELGFIKSAMIDGDNWDEYIVKCHDGRKKAVNVVCQTSDAGDIYKKLIKKAEDCVINNVGFLVHNNTIISESPYKLKIHESQIRFIEYIFPNNIKYNSDFVSFKKFNDLILFLHEDGYVYVNKYIPNLSHKVIFYFDLPIVIEAYDFTLEHEKYKNEEEFISHIEYFIHQCNCIYYFNLTNLNSIKYVLLTYLIKYNNVDLTNYILDKIEFTLLTSLNAGDNIIGPIQTISATYVQQALSSFHSTTKSGQVIKIDANIDFKKIIVNNTKVIGKIKILSKNEDLIKKIKYAFNYVNLLQFEPVIDFTEYNLENNEIKITFIKKNLIYNIKLHELLFIIYNFIYNYRGVFKFDINIVNEDSQYIVFNINIVFDSTLPEYKYYEFIKGLNFGMYKGKIYNSGIQINYKYRENLEFFEIETYIINLNEVLEVISFNELNQISIIPNYIIAEEIYGSIIASFFFTKELYDLNAGEEPTAINEENIFAIDFISKLLSKDGGIDGILSTKDMTAEKACQSGAYKRYITSAIKNITDPMDDNTSRLVNTLPLKVGTGYNPKFIDLNMLERMVPNNYIKNNNYDISEITPSTNIFTE